MDARSVERSMAKLKGNRDIVAVLLFGSALKGGRGPLSDIDICIVPRKGANLEETMRAVPDVDADVCYFNQLPLHVKIEALKGRPIVLNDKNALREITVRTVIEHLDFNPLRERLIRNMLAKGVFQ